MFKCRDRFTNGPFGDLTLHIILLSKRNEEAVEARANRPGLPMANICQKEDDSTFLLMSHCESYPIVSYKNYNFNRFDKKITKHFLDHPGESFYFCGKLLKIIGF